MLIDHVYSRASTVFYCARGVLFKVLLLAWFGCHFVTCKWYIFDTWTVRDWESGVSILEVFYCLYRLGVASDASDFSKAGTRASRILRILRLIRLFRVAKLYKNSRNTISANTTRINKQNSTKVNH